MNNVSNSGGPVGKHRFCQIIHLHMSRDVFSGCAFAYPYKVGGGCVRVLVIENGVLVIARGKAAQGMEIKAELSLPFALPARNFNVVPEQRLGRGGGSVCVEIIIELVAVAVRFLAIGQAHEINARFAGIARALQHDVVDEQIAVSHDVLALPGSM